MSNATQDQLALIMHTLAEAANFEAHYITTGEDIQRYGEPQMEERVIRQLGTHLGMLIAERLPYDLCMIKSDREKGEYGPGSVQHTVKGYLITKQDMNDLTKAIKSLMRLTGYDPRKPGY